MIIQWVMSLFKQRGSTQNKCSGPHYVIIGNGVAGVEAAKQIRKFDSNAQITMISRESKLHWSRPALMYVYMGELSEQDVIPYPESWFLRKKIDLHIGTVLSVNREDKLLTFADQTTLSYDALLIATGSRPKSLEGVSFEQAGVMGLYHLQDLAYLNQVSEQIQSALIVGGGLIGVEFAEMLIHRGIKVELVTQDSLFSAHLLPKEEAQLVTEHIRRQGVNLYLSDSVESVIGESNNQKELSKKTVSLRSGQQLNVDLLGIAIGVEPAVQQLSGIDQLINIGVQVDQNLRTKDPYIFAAGDCTERLHTSFHTDQGSISEDTMSQQFSGTWYEARAMGQVVGCSMVESTQKRSLADEPDFITMYNPHPHEWFNSSKFFEIEHQVYGEVLTCSANQNEGPDSLLWIDEQATKSIRIVHRHHKVTGFCAMGMRLRQELCLKWIKEARDLEDVLQSLSDVGFDPEFNQAIYQAQNYFIKLCK